MESQPFKGSVKTMAKPECIRLCDALDISNEGLLKELRSRLEAHLNEHSAHLTSNPQFSQLYYSGKGSGKPRKVTEDKDKEDTEADLQQEKDAAAATLKKLVAQGIPKDPPSKPLPLSAVAIQVQHRQRQDETNTFENESNDSSHEQDELDSSSLPVSEQSAVHEEEDHEVTDMMRRASLTPSLAPMSDFLMVSLRDYSNQTGPPVFQGHISTDNVPMTVHDDPNGKRIRRVKLSHVLPALIAQHTPVKQPGGRFYAIPPRAKMTAPIHIGAIEKIEQGVLRNYPPLLDYYEATESNDLPGAFEVQLLWDKPKTIGEPIAGPVITAGSLPSKVSNTSLRALPEYDVPSSANEESDDDPELMRRPVKGDPKFLKFLRKALGIRDSEWPKASNLTIALQRYNATEQAIKKLEEWGWCHSSGGYFIPRNDPRDTEKRWAGAWFDIQTAREGVFVKHAAAHEDRALFEQYEDALPSFFKWVRNPTKPCHEKFGSWSLSKFREWREKQLKQLKKEQRKMKKKKRSRKSSSESSESDSEEERVVKRKKKKSSSGGESEDRVVKKKKKKSKQYVSTDNGESDDTSGGKILKLKKGKGRMRAEQDSDNIDED